jgi:Gly-Xaa carboxypeptidase
MSKSRILRLAIAFVSLCLLVVFLQRLLVPVVVVWPTCSVGIPRLGIIASRPCAQTAALIPEKNSELWDTLNQIISLETFRKRAVSSLSGSVQIPYVHNGPCATLFLLMAYRTETYDSMGPVGEDERWKVHAQHHTYLEKRFPLAYVLQSCSRPVYSRLNRHSTLEVEKANTYGLLYTWQGSDVSLKPIVLMAHQGLSSS